MSNLQFLRIILLLNNVSAAAVDFICMEHPLLNILSGVFLLLSWVYNLAVIGHTLLLLRPSKPRGRNRGAYIALPVTEEASTDDDDILGFRRMPSLRTNIIITLVDLAFAIANFILFMVGAFMVYRAAEAVGVVGSVVAATVHFFYFLYGFRWCILGQFTIQLSIKRLDQESRGNVTARPKESQPAQHSEQQQHQQLSPKSYHGSPSTKPSQETGTIKLTDPTETDTLMDDQE